MSTIHKPLIKKIYKVHKNRKGTEIISKKQIGVLVASIIEGKVSFGYSLCHRKDKYDWIPNGKGGYTKVRNFGINIATQRAIKWSNFTNVSIPSSIRSEFKKFVIRCKRYYKDKDIVQWA